MKRMLSLLYLVILTFPVSSKAEVNQTYFTGFQNETILTDINNTIIWGLNWPDGTNVTSSITTGNNSVNQALNASKSTYMTTMGKMAPESKTTSMVQYTTKRPFRFTSQYAGNHSTNTASTPCVCQVDRYKTGVMICAIIIAVLVLICAALIICSVALANKVSSLKTKLTQSKRQARSNGDFLSASSILWSPGVDTWQKKSQTANQTMDEISLGEGNVNDEKHKLMTVTTLDKLKDPINDKKANSLNNETMTIVSTVEV